MEHIVRRHNIPIEYPRCFKPVINVALRNSEQGGKFADAICYKLKGIGVHISFSISLSKLRKSKIW